MKLWAKKALGQHFLADPNYCRKIVRCAEIEPPDTVVEIGPGTGQLTRALLSVARRVIAIEFDRDLVQHLRRMWPESETGPEARLTVIEADVLSLDWNPILVHDRVKIVGNLPYNIATRVLTKMTEYAPRFQSLTCMVQKEVAERLLARPGSRDCGYLSLLMEYHFDRRPGFDVPPGVFVPKPKVMSHVLTLVPRPPLHPVADYPRFLALLRKAFQHRRKTLANNLRGGEWGNAAVLGALQMCGISSTARPEQVTLAQYACLTRVL